MHAEMQTTTTDRDDDQFVANGIRLPGCQWLLVALLVAGVFLALPGLWETIEEFEPGPDYRIPHLLSEDYWLYERWARRAARETLALYPGAGTWVSGPQALH